MRDLLIVGFLLVAIFYAFKRPYLGVTAWVWIALAAPTEWAFGFSQSFRPNLTIVLVTAIAYLFSGEARGARFNGLFGIVVAFCGWTFLSTAANDSFDSAWVWDYWVRFVKVVLLFICRMNCLQFLFHHTNASLKLVNCLFIDGRIFLQMR